MSNEEPEVGDQVSWQHGSSNPSGEVSEKKAEGEVSVQSKRGNTIKRKAEPENPAVALERSGNDVVKNQNELTVEEKRRDDETVEESIKSPKTGDKRPPEDDVEEEPAKKAKAGRGRPKKTDATNSNATTKKKTPAEKKVVKKTTSKTSTGEVDPNKKGRGRPKKEEGATSTPKPKAPKKEKTPRAAPNGTGVGSRTRSAKK